ncbi:sialidase family protein [Nocardioides sp. SYSU DS0663]|uniref:sialidase family protein n=1 Tax=Nocardioides sp. SYSU DS0663 TaxID=3416445 RepID=UPI003F4B45FF
MPDVSNSPEDTGWTERSRRRRRWRWRWRATVLAGATLATVAVVTGTLMVTDDGSRRSPATAEADGPLSSAPPSDHDDLSAAEIVDHPDAVLADLVVAPGNDRVRAAVWRLCRDEDCRLSRRAVTVTADGFRTRSDFVVGATPLIRALSGHAFHVGWNPSSQLVVRSDGSTLPIEFDDAVRPQRKGEELLGNFYGAGRFGAVDPVTGRAHAIPVPKGLTQLVAQPDGTLLGTVRAEEPGTVRVVWSTDGGGRWQGQLLDTVGRPLVTALPSARPGALAVVEGSDGTTLFPLLRVHRSLDGGATWESFDLRTDPQAYLGTAAVLPDGRLLVDIQAWSDQRPNQPSAEPVGLHASDGARWSALAPVDLGDPFAPDPDAHAAPALQVVGMSARPTRVEVLARLLTDDAAGDTLFVSRDGGESWEDLAAR